MSTAPQSAPRRSRHRGLRRFGRIVLYFVAGIVVLVLAGLWFASTASFANYVRAKLVDVLSTATGGRVEVGGFRWHPLKLEAEVDQLTIHGLEAPGEVPYAHVDKVALRAKIIDLFKAQVGLRWLEQLAEKELLVADLLRANA